MKETKRKPDMLRRNCASQESAW